LVRQLREFRWGDTGDDGQALVEYTLILALVALVAIPLLTTIGVDVATLFGSVSDAFP
jgi:Flp pilus assembly pilin Flp